MALRKTRPFEPLREVVEREHTRDLPGLLAQFVWQRLRHPDPWQAVQQRFGAHGASEP